MNYATRCIQSSITAMVGSMYLCDTSIPQPPLIEFPSMQPTGFDFDSFTLFPNATSPTQIRGRIGQAYVVLSIFGALV